MPNTDHTANKMMPIWTPDDYTETLAAARRHPCVVVTRPRHRWAGPWILWTTIFGAIIGATLYYSVPAHASVPRPAQGVCSDLDTAPNYTGVNAAFLTTLAAMNPTSPNNVNQAAVIIVNTVKTDCPQYMPLLVKYAHESQK